MRKSLDFRFRNCSDPSAYRGPDGSRPLPIEMYGLRPTPLLAQRRDLPSGWIRQEPGEGREETIQIDKWEGWQREGSQGHAPLGPALDTIVVEVNGRRAGREALRGEVDGFALCADNVVHGRAQCECVDRRGSDRRPISNVELRNVVGPARDEAVDKVDERGSVSEDVRAAAGSRPAAHRCP